MTYIGLSNDQIANQELMALRDTAPCNSVHNISLGVLADRIHRRLQSLGYVVPDFYVAQRLHDTGDFLVIIHSQATGGEEAGEYPTLTEARDEAARLVGKPIYFDGEQIATVESAWVQDRQGNTY